MTASRIWIKNPLALYTANDHKAPGGLVIDQGVIVEMLGAGQSPSFAVDSTFDAREHVVLPGLINTHHHFYQTLTRAWGPVVNQPLFPWLKTLYPVWARLTPDRLALASKVALAELLLSGCTTAADHHYLFPDGLENAIDIQIDVVRELGMRAMLTRGSMSLGEADGGLPPQHTVQTAEAILEDSERLIGLYHERGAGAQIQIGLAPCSPFSVTPEIMRASAALAEHHDVRLHTHLAETLDEEEFCLQRFGLRTVDYLDSVGWLSERTWLAHGIHFNDEEIARLGAAGTGICHCPCSNMRLASGICPTVALEAAGAPIGLGVDGSASNDASNMILEARQALYIQRLRYGAEAITPERALGWATRGSARLLGRDDVGELAVGKQADLALFKLDELRFSGSHDPIAALLLCGADRADQVMVGGKWRVIDGQIEGLDVAGLIANHSQAARELIAG
ncbi:8-oxoguanine deaminase [Pseudomonas sp. Choline-3u-10]|jgi:8-oxoguanine deaminase|uniref:8-oxoguanine deaminase n=1 Tax=Pseudomonadaceae TaxID=135621 RepID=UPI0006181EE2|nr:MULTISPECIES: 8-oxoguanine deaminase [Pseudomonadaceae]MAK87193.1 8-oxoguanine deaminase [Pseudomonas sp.]MBU0947337.1 8-oxoguanine deaminase [Gammaproteobacteria bacterium]KJJ63539.1 8-oxoguanine deaminase [Pseudomonas sp. 10B238]MBK3794640.1 8-oxoguanine deaminase [Stutzerimonas stutzeri]MBK3879007.1 8-oxoguanine deaminase [Stutzerimonas stutzeri]|tara:strand:- start:712 stop:2067 length:1356 start_codon:yes stop_codon:yes gene_type:complete